MMPTPKTHLPKGYPLASPEESKRFEKIFERAFDIHETAHDFDSYLRTEMKGFRGMVTTLGPRRGILSPVRGRTKVSKAQYCDCYEQAYQELKSTLK